MYQNALLFIYRSRLAFAMLLAAAIVTLTSVLVTSLGANTVLDTKTHPIAVTLSSTVTETPNAVTDVFSGVGIAVQHGLLRAGIGVYSACRSVTSFSAASGRATGHSAAMVGRGIWIGVASVGRGVGTGVVAVVRGVGTGAWFALRGVGKVAMFGVRGVGSVLGVVFRLPGKAVGSVTHGNTVNAIIQPSTDTAKSTTPVIDAETSNAILAKFNAAQQKSISDQLAQQLAANQALDGQVVAGDAKHGGYPAKYDAPVAQDSLIDSWGMYNRECVSYAAWKVYQTYGNMPYWGGVGNANQWLADARNTGIPTGAAPKVHSVAISLHGYYGHAAWVEAVNGDMIYVSQYNYDLNGHYSEMWVKASNFTYIYFQ